MSKNGRIEPTKSNGSKREDVDKIVTNVYKAGSLYGITSVKDVYKAGTFYGTVSVKDIYKAGTYYGTVSIRDF